LCYTDQVPDDAVKRTIKTSLVVCWCLVAIYPALAKDASRLVTAEERANAQQNIMQFPWAEQEQQAAISAAGYWLNMSDDDLWQLIPAQELPRGIHTNKVIGCPNCGDGIVPYGNYPWRHDFWNNDFGRWKIKCPNCGQVYPKNDFKAFYDTALDEHGMFRRALGDRSLLHNETCTDTGNPACTVHVDDGYGMLDADGNTHFAIAYYVQWGHWRTIYKAVNYLTRAYSLTGDTRYAHKCAVLLDRIADVYPEMDFRPLADLGFEHSHGGSGEGRIEGRIWESHNVCPYFARAYDRIFDGLQGDQELVQFCSAKSQQFDLGDKSSIDAICAHIEDDILLQMLDSIKEGRLHGNTGRDHICTALAAIALDRPVPTREWLDWLFDPGFPGDYTAKKDPVPWVLTEGLDRDGMGGECGNYGLIWVNSMHDLVEILSRYPDYAEHDLAVEYPKLKQSYFITPRLLCLGQAMPHIGDTGSTGSWSNPANLQAFVRGYRIFRDPRLAAWAWRLVAGDLDALRPDDSIFEDNPMALPQEIASVAGELPDRLRCEHLGRYGLAVVQTENKDDGRAIWIHYGDDKGHIHYDILNLGLYAKNIDMLPDLGYPEYTGTWPKRIGWTSHTVSHCTLMVNDARSIGNSGGQIHLFADQAPARVFEVSSRAYPDLDSYRRTAALIDVSGDNSYILDIFRARRGSNHRLSYHGPSSTAEVAGLSLASQAVGTFAGEDVSYGEFYDGTPDWNYPGSGFMYLDEVERSTGPVSPGYTVDWLAEDLRGRILPGHEPHLRLHALTPCDEVALASGYPPSNKSGNPEKLRYLIQSRLGDELASQFVTVLEPYDTTPFVQQVRTLSVVHDADPDTVTAVAIDLASGETDVVISCEHPTRVSAEGGIEFEGKFGQIRFSDGEVELMRMSHACLLEASGVNLTSQVSAYTGMVTAIDVTNPENTLIYLEPGLPPSDTLVGTTIHFDSPNERDTSFEIKGIGPGWIATGDITVVAGFNDPLDFESGLRSLVNPGDAYTVPRHMGYTDGQADPDPGGPACALQEGVCAGSTMSCVCGQACTLCAGSDYGPDYQAEETRCDGLDNDCDGETDEGDCPEQDGGPDGDSGDGETDGDDDAGADAGTDSGSDSGADAGLDDYDGSTKIDGGCSCSNHQGSRSLVVFMLILLWVCRQAR